MSSRRMWNPQKEYEMGARSLRSVSCSARIEIGSHDGGGEKREGDKSQKSGVRRIKPVLAKARERKGEKSGKTEGENVMATAGSPTII